MPGWRCRPSTSRSIRKRSCSSRPSSSPAVSRDSPEIVMERAWIGRVIEAPTGARRLALIVEYSNDIYARVGPLLPAVSAASSVDPDVGRAWQGLVARRRAGMARVIEVFDTRGELRDGLDRSLALDLMFGINRAETFLAFTVECGWTTRAVQGVASSRRSRASCFRMTWPWRLWQTARQRSWTFRSGTSSACSPERPGDRPTRRETSGSGFGAASVVRSELGPGRSSGRGACGPPRCGRRRPGSPRSTIDSTTAVSPA